MSSAVKLVPDVPPAVSHRADYYLFRQFIVGFSPLNDAVPVSTEAMKLVFGVNRPFSIMLEDKWHSCRTALLSGNTPHIINGKDDWQVVIWIDPGCSLQLLLDARTLDGRPWMLFNAPVTEGVREVVQTVRSDSDAAGALQLAETLLRVYGGVQPVPAVWDDCIKKAIRNIDKNPADVSSSALAGACRRDEDSFNADFFRVAGMQLKDYIFRSRIALFFKLRSKGVERPEALKQAELYGWDGLKDLFWENYALNLDIFDTDPPCVRFFADDESQASLYL